MYIVVDSLTGTSLRFASKLGHPVIKIKDRKNLKENDKFFLITRCQNFGEIPTNTQLLLDKHADKCIGVAVSGNKNWGKHYGVSGDVINEIYDIELVLKFEGTGYPHEVEIVKEYIKNYEREHKND